MSFDHIKQIENCFHPDPFVMAYGLDDELCGAFLGFEDVQEVLSWMASMGSISMVCLQGMWAYTDDGDVAEFDGEELRPGDTWEKFSRRAVEFQRELEADRRHWRKESAREAGMLGGINAYNDWA